MEDPWLTSAKRLQSIASTGLHFSRDRYDRERYEEIAHIADKMLARPLRVVATRLYALHHKAKHPYPPDARDFYKLFFLCDPIGEVCARPGPDTIEVGFFPLGELPPLSRSRTIRDDIAAAFASVNQAIGPAQFD